MVREFFIMVREFFSILLREVGESHGVRVCGFEASA